MAKRTMIAVFVLGLLVAAGVAGLLVAQGGGGFGSNRAVLLPVIAAVGVAFVIIAVVVVVRRAKAGRSGVKPEAVAAQLGLTCDRKPEPKFHQRYQPLPGIPQSGRVQLALTGSLDGRRLTIFQHLYMINTGQAAVPVHHTVYATGAPRWPTTTIKPRRGLSWIAHRLGFRRGLLLEDEQFNASFRVLTEDEDFALTLLHPEMQQFLLTHRAMVWQINPGQLAMIYRGTLKADRIEASLERLRQFRALVPEEMLAW